MARFFPLSSGPSLKKDWQGKAAHSLKSIEGLPDRDLLKPKEVAAFFRVSIKKIYEWQDEGIIRGINLTGKMIRIFRSSVIALIQNGSTEK